VAKLSLERILVLFAEMLIKVLKGIFFLILSQKGALLMLRTRVYDGCGFLSRDLSNETKCGTKIKTYSLNVIEPLQKHFVAGCAAINIFKILSLLSVQWHQLWAW
jgi:hypothetical protein